MTEAKYKEGDRFFEITFQIPMRPVAAHKLSEQTEKIAHKIIDNNKGACNIKVIPCRINVNPARLKVSKDDYSYTVWNSKQESQLIKETRQ